MKKYFYNIFVWLSEGLNVIFTGGDPEESLSEHAARRMYDKKWACRLCKFLDWFDKQHCEKSLENLVVKDLALARILEGE